MKKHIYRVYRVLRSIVVTLLLLFVALYSLLYILMSVPAVQQRLKSVGEQELTKLLGVDVEIRKVSIDPLNEVMIEGVSVPDKTGRSLLDVGRLGAGLSLRSLLLEQRVVIDYVEIIGLDAHLAKETPESPLNIQFVIDAFKPKQKNKPPTKFDVEIDAVVIRKSSVSYDVLSANRVDNGRFDKNHIRITQLSSDIRIPKCKNDTFEFDVKRLSLVERSGFVLSDFSAFAHVDQNNMEVGGIKLSMPNSTLIPEDISLHYGSLKTMVSDLKADSSLDFKIANSYVSLSDLRAFLPELQNLTTPIYVTCAIGGSLNDLNISAVDLNSEDFGFSLQTSGHVRNLLQKDSISVDAPTIKFYADTRKIVGKMPKGSFNITEKLSGILSSAGYVSVNGSLKYNVGRIFYAGNISTAHGSLQTNGTLSRGKDGKNHHFVGSLSSRGIDVGAVLGRKDMLNDLAFNINANVSMRGSLPYGTVRGTVNRLDIKNYRYGNIVADVEMDGRSYEGKISLNDPNADVEISGLVKLDGENSIFDVGASIAHVNLNKLNLTGKYPEHSLNAGLEISMTGNNPDNAEGDIIISDLRYVDENNEGVKLSHFDITSRKKGDSKYITLNSDLINGYIDGSVNFANMVPAVKSILSVAFPSLFESKQSVEPVVQNDFKYYFKLAENNEVTSFFNLPIRIVHPIEISGIVDEQDRSMSLGIDAPYIMQGKKVLENNSLSLNVDGANQMLSMNLVTKLDNKNGDITLIYNGNAADDRLDSDINWRYDRQHDFSGKISLSSLLKYDKETKQFDADIDVNPTSFMVNDTTWNIAESNIKIAGKRISLNDINVYRENQFIKADGAVSSDYDDELKLQLRSIDLGYVFETLNINHVAFSGLATGDFYASGLLTSAPRLNTTNLNVKNFAYHKALLGEADIDSSWDNENKGIVINADIHQANGRESFVHGIVYPTRDSLAFKFNADRLNVQILKPFMAAFTSDVSGEASGEAELYGTFKLINMKGRLYTDNFKMKVDYTNTYYTVADSIILDPGIIRIPETTVHDQYGNTAKLNGTVRHDYFKNARFDFSITEAKNILCYNTDERMNPVWYGKVFASGSAFVRGIPGQVDLDLNMSSSANSNFTFVLSDKEEAGEYSFITFTDKRKAKRIEEEQKAKKIPDFLRREQEARNEGSPSVFNLNLQVDVNPNIAITLVMDPDGGDRIRGTGSGNLRIEYASNGDMKMFGNYTVDEGKYNFTLQDIIIREFTIKQGGTIAFHGDPMEANVDLSAAYSLNANLADLDESFAQDKDLNRTMVPVNALLNLSGVISQPEISFDLEFPTLTQDVYRKVKSIVSTDDMMNQQIIYLLALSRFYTPEYMGSTNRGNELASVASSTISSQLTNILGQLSDKWSIAPNFHTDKGDFSDMEVELALSSRLLNNRLLFNGNFGYSDNSMNNNSFIGDFDIEYLLTKSGNFRLKAYNRYNDQNYYIRNSLTTQGVGIVFKHDFDHLFRRKRVGQEVAGSDTLVPDSLSPKKRKPVKRNRADGVE